MYMTSESSRLDTSCQGDREVEKMDKQEHNAPAFPSAESSHHFRPAGPKQQPQRAVVTGGAGVPGSPLRERLLAAGLHVLCVENFHTGSRRNIAHRLSNPPFELLDHAVVLPLEAHVTAVYNLASPASPKRYQRSPVQTVKTNVRRALQLQPRRVPSVQPQC